MPIDVREQIVAATVAALTSGAGKPAGLTVDEFRLLPGTSTTGKRIGVYWTHQQSHRVGQNRGPLTKHALRVRLEIRCPVPANTAAGNAIGPLLTYAIQALFADESLGGLALAMEEGEKELTAHQGEQPYALCLMDVVVWYATLANDPTRQRSA